MSNGPFVSYVKDADGRFVFYNTKLAERFRVDEQQWIGLRDHEVWPKEMADKFRQHDVEVLNGGVSVELQEISPAPDGGVTHWKSYKFPFADARHGQMLAGISLDLTKHNGEGSRTASRFGGQPPPDAELEASQVLLQTFHENSRHVAYMKSADGRYISYNKRFAEYFGFDLAAWIGRSDHEVFPAEIAHRFRAQGRQVLESDQRVEICDQF
jgi:PAS domain-containing protein